jgi:hypothetical protein
VRSLRRALLALGVVGFVARAVPLALALGAEQAHQRELLAVFGPLTGWAFIGTGIFAWLRRPDNGFGALMTAVGFSACLAALRVSTEPWVFIAGLLFIALPYALLFHLLLAFPTGALQTRFERLLVAATYASAVVVHPVQVLFQDTTRQGLPGNRCSSRASRTSSRRSVASASPSACCCWPAWQRSSPAAGAPRAARSDGRSRPCC